MAPVRRERKRNRPFRLNQRRDPQIFFALTKMRFLRTRDISKLYFNNKLTANKRLRRLFDAGYIQAWVQELYADNIYSLHHKGRAFLVQHMGFSGDDVAVPTGIKNVNLNHLFGINSFRISLSIGIKETPGLRLALFRPDWQLQRLQMPLIPDAIFMIEDTRNGAPRRHYFSLEYDSGTEPLSYWIKKKAGAYLEIRRANYLFYGLEKFTIVVVAPSKRRIRTLAKAIYQAGGRHEFLFGEEGAINGETILGETFLSPMDSTPSSQERDDDVSPRYRGLFG